MRRRVPDRLGHNDRIDLVEDSRMDNIVSLGADRRRPQRLLGVPRSGARILLFTGIRYCREEEAPGRAPVHAGPSERVLDAAAH